VDGLVRLEMAVSDVRRLLMKMELDQRTSRLVLDLQVFLI